MFQLSRDFDRNARLMAAWQVSQSVDRLQNNSSELIQPIGFDMVLACDIGLHNEVLIAKLALSLNVGGQFVLADDIATDNIVRGLADAVHDFKKKPCRS